MSGAYKKPSENRTNQPVAVLAISISQMDI
jgi:hypothetical protein